MTKQIEPYRMIQKTNIKEHNDMVNKINEIVDVINDTNLDTVNAEISALKTKAIATDTEIANINAKDSAQDTEINGITKSLVSNVSATFDNPSRELKISLGREASPSIDATVVIPSSSETGQYSAGNGITIDNYQIAVNTEVVALKTDIPVVPDISQLTADVEQTKTDIQTINTEITGINNKNTEQDTAIAGKVAISQGTENAGKVLGIGSDGNVTPVTAGGGSGGSGWETLDLSNLPNDFSEGDTLLIDFKCFSSATATSWTSSISNVSINSQAENLSSPILINLIENAGSNVNCNKIINISSAGGYESYLLISIVYPVSTINSGGNILRITASAFNGAGPYRLGNTSINRTNVSDYIRSIKRLKAST